MEKQDLEKEYQSCGMLVLPSRQECWGLVINEAMAYGLPVITTERCVAGLELIENGVNGYLEDDDEIIAHRIIDIVTNQELRKVLSDNSKRLSCERNDIGEYKRKIEEQYEKSIGNNNNVRRGK